MRLPGISRQKPLNGHLQVQWEPGTRSPEILFKPCNWPGKQLLADFGRQFIFTQNTFASRKKPRSNLTNQIL